MAWLVPLSIFVGALLPQIFEPINAISPMLFAIMAFQGALSNHFREVAHVFRPPILISLVLLLGTFVLPILGYALASLVFGDDPAIVSGITLYCAAPTGNTCMIWVGLYGGNAAFALTATLITAFFAPFTIPLTLQLLVGASVEFDAVSMMLQLLFMVVIPSILGMALTEKTHGWGETSLAPKLAPLAFVLMQVINCANASTLSDFVWTIGFRELGIVAFMLGICLLGYGLGLAPALLLKLPPREVVAMALSVGLVNVSAASVLATAYLPSGAVFPVMVSLLFQATIAALIGQRFGEPDTDSLEDSSESSFELHSGDSVVGTNSVMQLQTDTTVRTDSVVQVHELSRSSRSSSL